MVSTPFVGLPFARVLWIHVLGLIFLGGLARSSLPLSGLVLGGTSSKCSRSLTHIAAGDLKQRDTYATVGKLFAGLAFLRRGEGGNLLARPDFRETKDARFGTVSKNQRALEAVWSWVKKRRR